MLDKYYDTKFPASFTGAHTFQKALTNKICEVQDALRGSEAYEVHRPFNKRFKRNRVIVPGIDHTWQADLLDTKNIKGGNYNTKFVLTVIDVFSKYGWARPLATKSAEEVVEKLRNIIESSGRKPKKLHTDDGREFNNKKMHDYLASIGASWYKTTTKIKAGVVERFNRTLRERLWRLLTYNKTNPEVDNLDKQKYIKYLQNIVEGYNNSWHRSIKNLPININKNNEQKTFKILYGFDSKIGSEEILKFKFKIGDIVRVAKAKYIFDKGYTQNWSSELFRVIKVIPRSPPVYEIEDKDGNQIEGIFYAEQLL